MAVPASAANSQALPAFETLSHMNASTAKCATWIVRVISDPKIVSYTFSARGERVEAQKLECVLVSADPSDYMLGLVPFSFSDRSAAAKGMEKYLKNTVWEIKVPVFETKTRKEYISTPVKRLLLLTATTSIRAVAPTETIKYNYPSRFVSPLTNLAGALGLLRSTSSRASAESASGSPAQGGATRSLDLCLQLVALSSVRTIQKGGKTLVVAEMEGTDDSMSEGFQACGKVALWDGAHELLQDVPLHTGVTLIGCTATQEDGEVKLNAWRNSVHVIIGGDRAQTLSGLGIRDASELRQVGQLLSSTRPDLDGRSCGPHELRRSSRGGAKEHWIDDRRRYALSGQPKPLRGPRDARRCVHEGRGEALRSSVAS